MNKVPWSYSAKVLQSFIILGIVYIIVFFMLLLIQWLGYVKFTNDVNGDILKLATTLPFVAFYIMVFIGATAGFARSTIMARELPFNKILNSELKKRTMKSASIMTKIRSGATVDMDTPYLRAVDGLITARLPILPILEGDKVIGVITYYDIVKQLQSEIEKSPDNLGDVLKNLKVKDLKKEVSASPVKVNESENLKKVLDMMIKNHYNKLVVVKSLETNVYSGIVDVVDVTSELLVSEEGNDDQE